MPHLILSPPTCAIRISPEPVATVSPRFLSVAVDIAQVIGGRFWGATAGRDTMPGGSQPVAAFDFDRPQLAKLIGALAPAYLRIGGTASEQVYYDLRDDPAPAPPTPDRYTLAQGQWDALNRFALACGLQVAFTLNAGPGPRGANRAWVSDNAAELVTYTAAQGYPVALWALGNEPNFFPFAHRLPIWSRRLAADYATLKALLAEVAPAALIGGPASPFWPRVGELLPLLTDFVRQAAASLDVVTWHYYPQQSRRSPVATRRASPLHTLEPRFLDEFGRCAARVEAARDRYAPHAAIWLEETGNAQCGGEPGLSDRFVAGFWWLDQLGQAARRGHQVVVRQNISGADYGLLDEATLTPNPDYWNSLLWRRLMGMEVYAAQPDVRNPDLRVYAHAGRDAAAAITVLALNLNPDRSMRVQLAGAQDRAVARYLVTADDLLGKDVFVNGQRLAVAAEGAPVLPASIMARGPIELPPASYAFLVT